MKDGSIFSRQIINMFLTKFFNYYLPTNTMNLKTTIIAIFFAGIVGCQSSNSPQTIDLATNWRFSPDENNIGISENWYAVDFDDSHWAKIGRAHV